MEDNISFTLEFSTPMFKVAYSSVNTKLMRVKTNIGAIISNANVLLSLKNCLITLQTTALILICITSQF